MEYDRKALFRVVRGLLGYEPRPHQAIVHELGARFRVVNGHRRMGKTSLGAFEVLCHALSPNPIGEPILIFAPTDALVRRGWRRVVALANRLKPRITHFNNSPGDREMRLINIVGVETPIYAVTGKPPSHALRGGGIVGEGYQFAWGDEAAMLDPDVWAESVRPALADTGGSALLTSTPKGRNWFHKLFLRGQPGSEHAPGWASWQFGVSLTRTLPAAEIADAKATLSDRTFRQEFEAEFISSGAGLFNYQRLGALRPPERGHTYIGGLDVGREVDSTVLTIHDAATGEQVAVWRATRMPFEEQKNKLIEVWRPYHCTVFADASGIGAGLVELLERAGMSVYAFRTISKQKRDRALSRLQTYLEMRTLSISKSSEADVFAHELDAFSAVPTPGGAGFRYEAPAGEHDDCVMALAYVADELQMRGPKIKFRGL